MPDSKNIPLKDIKLGMCLSQALLNKDGNVIFNKGTFFASREQIQKLADEGIKMVSIDTKLSLLTFDDDNKETKEQVLSKKKYEDPIKIVSEIKQELSVAIEFFQESTRVMENIMDQVRFGKPLDKNAVQKSSVNIIDSVLRNQNAMFSLLNLKNFDEYTFTHSVNVAIIAVSFAHYLKFPKDKLISLGKGALIHDIGKAKIPVDIINKPGALTDYEFRLIQKHPSLGEQICLKEQMLTQSEINIITQHHEAYDGSGYPYHINGKQIDRFAAMVSIADFYDALTTERSYKKAFHPHDAIRLIYNQTGKKFDPRLVNHFIKTIGIYPVGSIVRLNSGKVAVVIAFNQDNILKPIIKIALDADNKPSLNKEIISLSESEEYIVDIEDENNLKIKMHEFL